MARAGLSDDARAAFTDELAHVIAKCRFGNAVTMDGRHNPRPSEVRAARDFVNRLADHMEAQRG